MSDEKEYVIRYSGSTAKSYFAGWVKGATMKLGRGRGTRTTGLPSFGATLKNAARYETAADAHDQVAAMPMMAGIMCDVRPVKRRPRS